MNQALPDGCVDGVEDSVGAVARELLPRFDGGASQAVGARRLRLLGLVPEVDSLEPFSVAGSHDPAPSGAEGTTATLMGAEEETVVLGLTGGVVKGTVGMKALSTEAMCVRLALGGDEGGDIKRPSREGDCMGDPSGVGTTEWGGEGARLGSSSCVIVFGPGEVLAAVTEDGVCETVSLASAEQAGTVCAVGGRALVAAECTECTGGDTRSKLIPDSSNPASSSGMRSTPVSARLLHSSGAVET